MPILLTKVFLTCRTWALGFLNQIPVIFLFDLIARELSVYFYGCFFSDYLFDLRVVAKHLPSDKHCPLRLEVIVNTDASLQQKNQEIRDWFLDFSSPIILRSNKDNSSICIDFWSVVTSANSQLAVAHMQDGIIPAGKIHTAKPKLLIYMPY